MKKIAVIDYGMSNLHSVLKAFQYVTNKNYEISVAKSIKDILDASIIVLPGQGAARSCMQRLSTNYPDLRKHILNKPFFGICLGFQILFEKSYEDNGVECFSLIKGSVNSFTGKINSKMKVPHMGWNLVKQKNNHPLWKSIPDKTFFYFVHSYYAQTQIKSNECSVTQYGIDFTSSVIKDNIFDK